MTRVFSHLIYCSLPICTYKGPVFCELLREMGGGGVGKHYLTYDNSMVPCEHFKMALQRD